VMARRMPRDAGSAVSMDDLPCFARVSAQSAKPSRFGRYPADVTIC
jgi:hypothetical protein